MKSVAIQKGESKNQSFASSLFRKNEDVSFTNDRDNNFEIGRRTAFNYSNIKVHNAGSPLRIQPKLQINQPGDIYEQEADAMADKVMRMSDNEASRKSFKASDTTIQRKCSHCEEEEEKKIQRKEINNTPPTIAPPIVHDVLNSSSGRPMDLSTRTFMESRFNHDFSNVKIHDNDLAASSAGSIDAWAYTSGNNIVFNNGKYAPNTESGKHLLAHELTHVVQANAASNQSRTSNSIDMLENEAQKVTKAFQNADIIPPILGSAGNIAFPLRHISNEMEVPTFGNLLDDLPAKTGHKRVELVKVGDFWYESPQGRGISKASGSYDFVVQDGHIWAVKSGGVYGHKDAAAGGRVIYAGQVNFGGKGGVRGVITSWSNASGHFAPVASFRENVNKNLPLNSQLPNDRFVAFKGEKPERGPQLPVFQPKGEVPSTKAPPPSINQATKTVEKPDLPTARQKPSTLSSSSGKIASQVDKKAEVPSPKGQGGALKNAAIHLGFAAGTILLGLIESYIKGKLDEKEIEKGIAAKWPAAQQQISGFSEEIEKLRSKPDTEKVYAVINVTVLRGRTFTVMAEGGSESVAQVESIAASEVSAKEKTVEPHDVMNDSVLMGIFNRKTIFTISVPLWSRAQEQAEARQIDQLKLADRMRKLHAEEKLQHRPQENMEPQNPSARGPSLMPIPSAPEINFLPGAPGKDLNKEYLKKAETVGQEFVNEGQSIMKRLGSDNPPTETERKTFCRKVEMWKTAMLYQKNWFIDHAGDYEVQLAKALLEDPSKPGQKLSQMCSQLI